MTKRKTEKPISKASKTKKLAKNKHKAVKSKVFSFTDLKGKKHRLTQKQKLFCEIMATLSTNGGNAVIDAGYNVTKPNKTIDIKMAWVISSQNLRKLNINAYIDLLLKDLNIDDTVADREHAYILRQRDDLTNKRGAIDMYYKLKGRYAPIQSTVTVKTKLEDLTPNELEQVILTGKMPSE